jgi:hypothetical protein
MNNTALLSNTQVKKRSGFHPLANNQQKKIQKNKKSLAKLSKRYYIPYLS